MIDFFRYYVELCLAALPMVIVLLFIALFTTYILPWVIESLRSKP